MVWSEPDQTLVIDPGADPEQISSAIKERNLTVSAYLLTHGHMDHISAINALHKKMPAPIALAPEDMKWAFTEANQMLPFYKTPDQPSKIAIELSDNLELTDIGPTCRIIGTPGHTQGSVCFLFPEEDILFAGDTLFAGSVGRTDLPGGDSRILTESLKKLAALPDSTTVYCGHGADTNIGHEKETNFFLRKVNPDSRFFKE